MNTKLSIRKALYALSLTGLILSACQKQDLLLTPTTTSDIVVLASLTSQDSVVLVQACSRREKREAITEAQLPTAVSGYVSSNYQGATFKEAFVIKDSAGTVSGYVVVVYFNDKPVGLRFDASGNFVKVLEQREKGDLSGPGFHRGGRFEHRDGMKRDSIALSALPSAITAYFAANYATDTLRNAFAGRDGNIVVLSINNGAFATVFDGSGNFIKREQLNSRHGHGQAIAETSLPALVVSYLSATYPNYVFKNAFQILDAGSLKGYVVFIDANNTRYAVEFDATGTFVRAKTIF